ncbi:hypothetical protein BMS3Abin01_00952 [bacterium BMS3Abin01]|nr:hypothetical protein BMS3Abin01_00952 [bacterium BMS3Abin01]
MKDTGKSIYVKPVLVKLENVRDITFECPNFQCSIPVPSSP